MITNIINNLFHGLWLYSLVLEPKHSRKKTALISAGATVVLQLFSFFLFLVARWTADLPGVAVSSRMLYFCGYCGVVLIFGVAFGFLLSASEPAKSLFLMSAYYSFWTLVYLIISVATNSYSGGGNLVIWGLRVGLNLSVLVLFCKRFKQKILRMYREIQIGYGMIVAISIFTFIVMTIVIFYNDSERQHDLPHVAMILSMVSMMVIIHLQLFRFIAQAEYVNQLKQMQLHEKYLREQINVYEQMEQNARQTRHDFRHHNMVVAEYAREQDYQGILSYLQEYETQEEETYGSAFCKNHVVNNVLRAYVARAKRKEIEVSCDIRLGEIAEISDYDLVSILANVLENAVNACERETGKRSMEISLRQKGEKLVFICKNTCTAKVLFKDGIPCNLERNGVGINSILHSVDKYDGSVSFMVDQEMFICRIILNNTVSGQKGEGSKLC